MNYVTAISELEAELGIASHPYCSKCGGKCGKQTQERDSHKDLCGRCYQKLTGYCKKASPRHQVRSKVYTKTPCATPGCHRGIQQHSKETLCWQCRNKPKEKIPQGIPLGCTLINRVKRDLGRLLKRSALTATAILVIREKMVKGLSNPPSPHVYFPKEIFLSVMKYLEIADESSDWDATISNLQAAQHLLHEVKHVKSFS